MPQRRQALERIVLHATNLRIPIVEVEGGTLTALAGFDGHQGVALAVAPRAYSTIEAVMARARERDEPPFVLALDSLEDPQNVGTLLRSAEAAGVHGVLFPTHRQAPLTPAAVKASAGAVEHLLLVPVDDLPAALADLHIKGLRVAGAEAEAPLELRDADLRGPLALVVGSEGQGLGAAVRRRCDLMLRIPMRGRIGSLNAAVAGSIVLFEALGQRGGASAGSVREAPAQDVGEAGALESSAGATPAEAAVSPETGPSADESGAAEPLPLADAEAATPSDVAPSDVAPSDAAPSVAVPRRRAVKREPTAETGRTPRARARVTARAEAGDQSSGEQSSVVAADGMPDATTSDSGAAGPDAAASSGPPADAGEETAGALDGGDSTLLPE